MGILCVLLKIDEECCCRCGIVNEFMINCCCCCYEMMLLMIDAMGAHNCEVVVRIKLLLTVLVKNR